MTSLNYYFETMLPTIFGESFDESPALPIISQYLSKFMVGTPSDLDTIVRQLSKCTGDGPSLAVLAHIYYLKSRNGDKEMEQKFQEYYQKVEELNQHDGYLTLSLIYFIGSLTDNNIDHDIKSLMSKYIGTTSNSIIESYYMNIIPSLKILRDIYGFGLTREEKEEKAIKLLVHAYKLNKTKVAKVFNGICELKSQKIIEYLMTDYEASIKEKEEKIEKLQAENLDLSYRPNCECGAAGGPGFLAAKEEFKQLLHQTN